MTTYDLADGEAASRIHLRVDADGHGVLIVNAARMIHLNPTAVVMAGQYLEKKAEDEVVKAISSQFNVDPVTARKDYQDVVGKLEALLDQESGLCPVCDLGLETEMPFSTKLSAPYRMDLALTYRCNNDCAHCYNARARNYPELDTADWKAVIDKVWEAHIPHVVFTGGEPTLRRDLPELIAYAQKKGMITGLNTNGRKLADPAYVRSLVEAGLDHVQITLESHDPAIHDQMVRAKGAWDQTTAGIRNAVNSKLYLMTNTTLLQDNTANLRQTLDFLAELGVPTIGLNALIYSGKGETVDSGLREADLPPLLEMATEFTQKSGQRLIWYTPTQYCHFNPLSLSLGIKGCTAALYNMCVEPDGEVIPCQSYYVGLGKLLHSDWEQIWNHPLALELRERKNVPEGCKLCDFFVECGGGCPLAREHQEIQPIYQAIL